MSQFQPMETSTLIIFQALLENLLDEVYEVLVNVLLNFHMNSCCKNVYLSCGVWFMILIRFEVLSQVFTFYLKRANIINAVLCSHKLLAIYPQGYFFVIAY